jgi:hypothetical protein
MYSDQLFISYSNSIILKDLGFKDKCIRWWPHENLLTDDTMYLQYKEDSDFCYCPIYDQAFLFLFTKFGLFHEIYFDVESGFFRYDIIEIDENKEAWEVEINYDVDLKYDNPFDLKDFILTDMLLYLKK